MLRFEVSMFHMKKIIALLSILTLGACGNSTGLKFLASLPYDLEEASGIELVKGSELLWMHNDSGNKPFIYGVDTYGYIQREVAVKAKNKDWEDVTSDDEGNLYIGDFGNNQNDRKDLVILKIKKEALFFDDEVVVEKIKFKYPDQYDFPPKKKLRFFNAESFFYSKGFLYVFTKSGVKNEYGKTKMYRIPTEKGKYEATFISEFNAGNHADYKITSASISPDQSKVALLTHNKILLFYNFISDDFLNGSFIEINLKHTSQKEAIAFKDNSTVWITDEKDGITGGNLYEFKLPKVN